MRRRSSLPFARVAACVLIVMAPAHRLGAQKFLNFGGLGARVGAVSPEEAKTGFGWSADVDAGYIRYPKLRVVLGLSGFSADVDRRVSDAPVGGSLSAFGGHAGLRFDAFGTGRLTPYLGASVTGHNVSADVTDAGTKQLLEGFYAGAGLGAGITFAFDTAGRFAATGEVRRVFVTNVSHWAFEVGVRWMPRGRGSYVDVERVLAEGRLLQEEQARIAAERAREVERQRLEAARRDSAERVRLDLLAQAQRDSLARARQDSAERARLDSLRRAEASRAEGQQRQAQQQIESLRERADSLEAARRGEAAGRVAAEAQADTARARAARAEAATREAEGRAAEADRRRYAALLDLHRLIADVTEIKETERGLAIILGQGLFASGQYQLSPRARDQVGTIAAVLAQYAEHRISVEGHTDAVGGELANQRLSELRAEAVRAALIGRGVEPGRIDMAGYGEGQPVADNGTAAGRAQNRRVEIVIVGARRPAERPGQ